MSTDQKCFLLHHFPQTKNSSPVGADEGKLPEHALWASFKRGDEAAFIQLYQQYAGALFNYGCQFSTDREMIKDCLQDFFIYLRKNRGGFGDPASVKMYLYKAFKRRVLDYLKKYRKECQRIETMMFSHFPVELSNETIFINRQVEEEQVARLNKALQALNPKEREAIFYFYYEGMSYEQIAEIFDFSHVSSARRLVYRGLGQLRKFVLLFLGLIFMFAAYGCSPKEGEATVPKRPNILFAIADDASFPHMGAYGTTWVSTPGFDRVAKEGILFMNAYTPNAKCAPSRACILTGRNPWQLEEAANHSPDFPAKFRTFMEVLRENGYYTGHTAKGWAPGNPGEVDGKRRELTGPAFNAHKTTPPTNAMSTNDYAANFEDFLNQKPDGTPFIFWYGSTEPHRRYEFRSGIEKGGKQLSDVDRVPSFWPDNDTVRADMLDYAYEIEYFDLHLQRMLDMLEERGELKNTLVVVTADNGMPFPRTKGQEYEYSNHLPLAVMWPARINNPGRKVTDVISFIDFSPTFLELAGIDAAADGMQPMTGKSLTDIFNSTQAGRVNPDRNAVLIGKERHDVGRPRDQGYPIRGIVTDEYLYLHNFEPDRWPAGNPETGYLNTDGSPTKTWILNDRRTTGSEKFWGPSFGKRPKEELYKLSGDRDCMENLALHPEYQAIKEELKKSMFAQLREQNDPRMFGQGHVFDEYVYAGEQSRGFYERYMRGEDIKAGWVNETDFEKDFPKK